MLPRPVLSEAVSPVPSSNFQYPTSPGSVGYSTHLEPSMTLGCGPMGGNITTDNIGPRHLLNIKRVAYPRAEFFAREGMPLAPENTLSGLGSEEPAASRPLPVGSAQSSHYGGGGASRHAQEMIERAMRGRRTPPSREFYKRGRI